jgi:Xaa-Pro aminopeptidase
MRHAPIDPALFSAHRERLLGLLPERCVAVVHAADILPTSEDGSLRIHPASDLFWLTGIEQEETVLVLAPDAIDSAQREMLFIKQPSDHSAQWDGDKLTQEKARGISGIATIRWLADLPKTLHSLLCESDIVLLNANEHERATTEVEPRDLRLARHLLARYPLHRHDRLAPLMRQLRAVKDPAEVDLLRRAIDITDAGLRRVLSVLQPGMMEYDLEAHLLAEFTHRRGKMAYEPIIGSGRNACVLHYHDNDGECRDGDLVLLDVGACYANYNADLTRTYPVNGRFTPRQRVVYEAVLRVLEKAIARTTVGNTFRAWKRAAQLDMNAELAALGLLSPEERASDTEAEPACKQYFMHGLGHSLGLGVHDLAPVDGPFAPGWVITVEPGIYIPEEGIGVRLENDVLVTADGPVDLCSHVPILPDEIEELMAERSAAAGCLS